MVGLGEFVARAGTGGVTRFGYDGLDLIAETDGSGTTLRRTVHGPGTDEPLLTYEGAGLTDRRYAHTDERGSVIATSNGAGAMLATNRYDDYGVPAATNLGRFQYTGQAWLPELGLYHYKARAYAPALGRFMQTDPIGYGDGINWYDYVGGDPVNFVDPLGLGGCGGPRKPSCADDFTIDAPGYGRIGGGGGGGGGRGNTGGSGELPSRPEPESGLCAAPLDTTIGSARAVLEAAALGADIATVGLAAGGVTGPAAVGTKLLGYAFELGLAGVNTYDAYANGNYGPGKAQIASLGSRLIPGVT